MTSFNLIPFDRNAAPKLAIMGEIRRLENQLCIEYQLTQTAKIILPQPANCPLRQLDLWLHTCCEFFLGLKDNSTYWEFNLSPAGHWNIFRFSNYRRNMAVETAFNTLPFQVLQQDNYLQVTLQIELDKIINPEQNIEAGITTVIEDRKNQLSYWALNHPAREADFHLRSSFTIAL